MRKGLGGLFAMLAQMRQHAGRSGQLARGVLARADAARDAREWPQAAAIYRAYLDLRPQAFGIWVQLGHALKESGAFTDADTAYRQAMAINAGDADLHVNLGHLLKMQGRLAEAMGAYRESVRLGGGERAASELAALEQMAGITPEGAGMAGAVSLPPLTLAFAGSEFPEFSTSDPLKIMRTMVLAATSAEALARLDANQYSPLISLIVPIYNTPLRYLHEMIQSVLAQTYTNWELCLVDDGSTSAKCRSALEELAERDDGRIRVHRLDQNAGIAVASDQALRMAYGDYVGFVDHDDLLVATALSEVVAALRDDPAIDYIYTDHCMVGEDGLPKSYARKPDWSPEFLLATNYIVHFKVVRRELLVELGGLANELPNVQDLGMSLRLMGAGARVRHLAKICYYWRDHGGSVASGSAAKPGIEGLLVKTYDRYLHSRGSSGHQTWPDQFQPPRIGVFKLEFAATGARVAVLANVRGTGIEEDRLRATLLPHGSSDTALHMIDVGGRSAVTGAVPLADDAALLDYVGRIDCDYLALVNTTARAIGPDWLRELIGYLDLESGIGAVGGKVLDSYLRVRAAGLLIDGASHYRTICGGSFDNAPGHWFIGQIASDVDAVSSALMVVRKTVLLEVGGIRLATFGDAAGVPFSAAVRRAGHRLVYNPFAKLLDPSRLALPPGARELIAESEAVLPPSPIYG